MILHTTKKLSAKLGPVSSQPLTETSPLGSWHANLYTIDRRNCVLFCHDETRYTMFLAGLRKPHFADLGRIFRELFTSSLGWEEKPVPDFPHFADAIPLQNYPLPNSQIARAEMALGPIELDSCTDRSVLGTLNQMKQMLDQKIYAVRNVMHLHPQAVARWLNTVPVRPKGAAEYWWPFEKMALRVISL